MSIRVSDPPSPVSASNGSATADWGFPVSRTFIEALLRQASVTDPDGDVWVLREPFTGRNIIPVPLAAPHCVTEAVGRARAAQPDWAARSFRDRRRIMIRFHDLLLDRIDEGLNLIQLESGKTRQHASEEVFDTAIVSRYYAYHARRILRSRRRKGAFPLLTSTREYYHPVGVVGIISPWNYPLSMGITDAIPALMAGNAVVIKPAEETPLSALWAAGLLREAGLPDDLIQILPGRGAALGPTLIGAIDFLCFTGSTETGRIVAKEAAAHLIHYSLELGGKNPLIVLPDADLDRAVKGALRACYSSAGQLCISAERLFVHADVFDAFAHRFASATKELDVRGDYAFVGDMGCLASEEQLAKISEHVEDAVSKGATLLAGGRHRPDIGPLFFEPTVLTGVTPNMKLAQEETFGPVVALYRFESEDDVIAQSNATEYGLNASIWSRRPGRARRLATRLQVGSANINEGFAASWASVDAPMGGFRRPVLGEDTGGKGS